MKNESGDRVEQLLIVSDLHLSEGRHPVTGRVSRHEDFFFDVEFADFLSHHLLDPRWSGFRWRLIINGDFIDFLQVTSLPDPASAGSPGLRLDPRYGLKAGARETVWKLQAVMQGHARFFDALAEFAALHKVVIISGNHDVEFWYPEVQQEFHRLLQGRLPADTERLEEKRAAVAAHLDFCHWFYYDGEVYVDHGHQYDLMNSFKYQLDPRLPAAEAIAWEDRDQIDLPWGSFFVRYLFNEVELDIPHADNIKPPTRFLFWFIRNHPAHAYAFLLGGGREMLRRVNRRWKSVPESAYAERRRGHEEAMERLASGLASSRAGRTYCREVWLEKLRRLDSLRQPPVMRQPVGLKWRAYKMLTGPWRLPVLITLLVLVLLAGSLLCLLWLLQPAIPPAVAGAVERTGSALAASLPRLVALPLEKSWRLVQWIFLGEVIFLLGWFIKRRLARFEISGSHVHLREKAVAIEALFKPRYIALGHVHEPDLWRLPQGGTYFNTSTWTKIFSDEERLIREEKELVYLRILHHPSGDTSAHLLKWESHRGEGRLIHLFAPSQKGAL